ncbi:LysR family transcriptional regulator (plasmid) [Embleya sp. NBC_00888]|uniref:LysR family transcriptional regulator n=1 Tax=Embleya sp. NBC_00888 TaxID=2975960 RepID=UPI002F912AA4|nr:LysR family transcriptional regulator [Embleya sp. NBC_00888]
MAEVELRELRYFRVVAEELNFSRAAERLGMTQPPLSRAIRLLERRLDTALFERDSHRVALTAAGEVLLAESRSVLDAADAAVRRTRRAAAGPPTLVVTAKPCVATDLLRDLVAAYRVLPAAPVVEVAVSGFGEQSDMVRDGRADAALLSAPYDVQGLELEHLLGEPRVAALPRVHPLAARETLTCADFADLPMPRWPTASVVERDYWAGRDRAPNRAGERPRGPLVHDNAQLLECVALDQAVALVSTSLAERNPRPDIVYRPVSDASPFTIAIAWRQGARNPWLARLVDVATKVAAETEARGLDTGAELPVGRPG